MGGRKRGQKGKGERERREGEEREIDGWTRGEELWCKISLSCIHSN